MATKQCVPIDPDNYGQNSYLGSTYCEYNVPVRMINRLVDEDLQRRHAEFLECCATEAVNSYEGEIFMPGVDLLQQQIAFGKWAIPKLKKELSSPDEPLVCKTLVSLIDLSYNPERCVEIICHNVIARLGKLVASRSPFIRQKVAILLRCIASAPYGDHHIAQNSYLLEQILLGARDPVDEVRHEYLRTIRGMLSTSLVIPELIAAGYLDTLISRLTSEPHEFCLLHIISSLEHLAHIGRQYQEVQIKAGVVNSVHELLKLDENPFSNSATRINLLGILAQLMKHPSGKQQFTPDLFELIIGFVLNDPDQGMYTDLQINSIRLLTLAAVTTDNKRLLVNSGRLETLIEKLINLANHEDKNLQLSSIYLLTAVSETKAGRLYMLKEIERIFDLKEWNWGDNDVIRALEILTDVIQWTP